MLCTNELGLKATMSYFEIHPQCHFKAQPDLCVIRRNESTNSPSHDSDNQATAAESPLNGLPSMPQGSTELQNAPAKRSALPQIFLMETIDREL